MESSGDELSTPSEVDDEEEHLADLIHTDEDRATSSRRLAVRWVDFYRELLGVEERVLDQMRSLAEGRPDSVRSAVENSNIDPMRELIETLKARLTFWEDKVRELGWSEGRGSRGCYSRWAWNQDRTRAR